MMAIGAALGPWATMVPCFLEKANIFVTRVVGCRYHLSGPVRLDDLSPGDRVLLIPDPRNPHDANAIQVTTRHRHVLGYVRRTIARKLAVRIGRVPGAEGEIVLTMGESGGAGDRVYIRFLPWQR